MKKRLGFVTNSSSSSFIISKEKLSDEQLLAIRIHARLAKELELTSWDEPWTIQENEQYITGYTWMDNFNMYEYLKLAGIDSSNIKWDEFPFFLDAYNQNEKKEL